MEDKKMMEDVSEIKERLMEGWFVSGKDFGQFKEELQKVDESTTVDTIYSADLTLLSIEDGDEQDLQKKCYRLSPNNIWKDSESELKLRRSNLNLQKLSSRCPDMNLVTEAVKGSGLMFMLNGLEPYLVSESAMPSICLRAGLAGQRVTKPGLTRDLFIAEAFRGKQVQKDEEADNEDSDSLFDEAEVPEERDHGFPVCMVSRKSGGVRKVFALMSGRYGYFPQTALVDIVDALNPEEENLGKMECVHWYIDNRLTRVNLEFPEQAKELQEAYNLPDEMIPGIELMTSDVGDCSVTVRGTWRVRGAVDVQNEYRRKHTSATTVEHVIESVKTKIFSDYCEVPKKMAGLLMVDLTNSRMPDDDKEKAVMDCYEHVFKQLDIRKLLGYDREQELLEELRMEINPALEYTAYDVAISVMTLTERLEGLNKTDLEALRKACCKAPFCEYVVAKHAPLMLIA